MSRPIQYLSSGNAIFDGNAAVCWVMDMTSNVVAPQIKNIAPGVLYTFVFRQSATGGHSFAWPTFVLNATDIDKQPSAVSTQSFVGMTGGVLYSNLPATWTERG